MGKNIVICCDGSGNQFGRKNSNVIKLFSALTRNSAEQVLYYHPGVGTTGSMEVPTYFGIVVQKICKLHGLAYGYGIISNVAHAYSFLMDSYEPGDKVFVFGFSRGAYTARVLCSMLYEFGLLEKGNQVLIEYAISLSLRIPAHPPSELPNISKKPLAAIAVLTLSGFGIRSAPSAGSMIPWRLPLPMAIPISILAAPYN